MATAAKQNIHEATFSIEKHPVHERLRHIKLDPSLVRSFLDTVQGVNVQNLEYVPFMRFSLAKTLDEGFGGQLGTTLRAIVNDRKSGGFTLGVEGATVSDAEYVKFGTAIGHLLGPGNHDAMSGTYYARFLVKDTDSSDSYLRQAYRLFTLHTDGTFVDEATDWLLMMKFAEENAVGGESRLLHIDDWSERDTFLNHELGRHALTYKAPGSKNVQAAVERPTFFENDYGLCISFIDQFAQPQTIEQAIYLRELSASMESSPSTKEIPLPVGDLVVLNNYFWLHGRAAFQKHPELHRELMRQRGMLTTK
ncbi:carbon starvation induced protein CsiD [Ensifer sp. ENS06]|uniref:glutarate dioxygenase GlaH n=1 Tax=Ensifer sp. ENS06 TaxID=2769276 RepID=UPI0017841C69|nr:glutarate dioxygenase GlaH [Ensifer sp. ENS06]MBD9626998.1 carbon starvation induced protein CsiD [Ensifer sp. ENS06]